MTNLLNTLRRHRRDSWKGPGQPELSSGPTDLLSLVWRPPPRADTSLPLWLHVLVGVSDDGLRVPGMGVKLGLDALLGTLLPGAGDALGGVTSGMLMYMAWRRGATRSLLFRMLGNATLDMVFGAIPVVGDIFDFGFHANRRNLSLLENFLRQNSKSPRATGRSLILMFVLLLVAMLLVVAAGIGLLVALFHHYAQVPGR